MPIYEYACTSCGERTEAKQSFDDPPLEECPHCGGKLRKLFSPVGIVFKGSGFYSTDAKSGSKSSGASDKPAESSKTETKSDAKSDAKPEAKKDTTPKEKSA
jgi:putative FmdB family regulatory protein